MMENLSSNNTEMINSEIDTTLAERGLLELWVDWFEANTNTDPDSMEKWKSLIFESKDTGKEILLLGICCSLWVKASGSDGVETKFLREIPKTGRVVRFAEELSRFQKSLRSFGIKLTPCLTVTSVEGLLLWKVGSERVSRDKGEVFETMNNSQNELLKQVGLHGGKVLEFNHLDIVMKNFQKDSIEELFKDVGLSVDKHIFDEKLFAHDVSILTEDIEEMAKENGIDPAGVVWLDTMSDAAKDRTTINSLMTQLNPNLPSIAPFRNNAKWASQTEPIFRTPNKLELVAGLLDVRIQSANSEELFIREILTKPDKLIEDFLNMLGMKITVNSIKSKNHAVMLIEKIVFNSTDFFSKGMFQEFIVPVDTTILDLVSLATNQRRKHIRTLIFEERVFVNGEVVNNPKKMVKNNMEVSIGKKTKIRVVVK